MRSIQSLPVRPVRAPRSGRKADRHEAIGSDGEPFPASGAQQRDGFYLFVCVTMTATVFTGFWITYFGPWVRGGYAEVPALIHVHGWSFFVWYLLLPIQAGMIRSGHASLHRTVGSASLALGLAMIVLGLVVSVGLLETAQAPDADAFSELMGLPIFGIWVLFTLFYVAAMRRRRRPRQHKRLILLASAAALSSATFRIVVQIVGFGPVAAVVGTLVPVIFPALGMLRDRRSDGQIHSTYRWGVPTMVLVIGGSFVLVGTQAGDLMERVLVVIGSALTVLS